MESRFFIDSSLTRSSFNEPTSISAEQFRVFGFSTELFVISVQLVLVSTRLKREREKSVSPRTRKLIIFIFIFILRFPHLAFSRLRSFKKILRMHLRKTNVHAKAELLWKFTAKHVSFKLWGHMIEFYSRIQTWSFRLQNNKTNKQRNNYPLETMLNIKLSFKFNHNIRGRGVIA